MSSFYLDMGSFHSVMGSLNMLFFNFLFALLIICSLYSLFLCTLLLCRFIVFFVCALFMRSLHSLFLCDLLCALCIHSLCALSTRSFYALFLRAFFMRSLYSPFLCALFMCCFNVLFSNAWRSCACTKSIIAQKQIWQITRWTTS